MRALEIGADSGCAGGPEPCSSLVSVTIVFSRFPLRPLRTAMFFLSSVNPISRSLAIFALKSVGFAVDGLVAVVGLELNVTARSLRLGGEGGEGERVRSYGLSGSGRAAAASLRAFEESGKMEDADLRLNLLPVFGGSGGGWSSELVLPVFWRDCPCANGFLLSAYFCRINRSIAESASSASIGIGGLVFLGL